VTPSGDDASDYNNITVEHHDIACGDETHAC